MASSRDVMNLSDPCRLQRLVHQHLPRARFRPQSRSQIIRSNQQSMHPSSQVHAMQSAISRHQPLRPSLPWKSICKSVANNSPNTVGGFNNRCRRLANIQQPPCPLLEPVVSRPSRSWPGVMRNPQALSRPPPACPCPSILVGFPSACSPAHVSRPSHSFPKSRALAYLPSARWHRTSCACTLPYLTLPLRNLPSPNGVSPQGRGSSPFDCKTMSHCRCNPVRPSGVGSGSNMRRTWR